MNFDDPGDGNRFKVPTLAAESAEPLQHELRSETFWAAIYQTIYDRLTNFAGKIFALYGKLDDLDTEDCVQEGIAKFLDHFDVSILLSVPVEARLKVVHSYLYHTVRNVVHDHLRDRGNDVSLEDFHEETFIVYDDCVEVAQVPARPQAPRVRKLTEAMKAMSARERDILHLKLGDHLTYPEIQDHFDTAYGCKISISALKMRYNRAIHKLIAAISEMPEFADQLNDVKDRLKLGMTGLPHSSNKA